MCRSALPLTRSSLACSPRISCCPGPRHGLAVARARARARGGARAQNCFLHVTRNVTSRKQAASASCQFVKGIFVQHNDRKPPTFPSLPCTPYSYYSSVLACPAQVAFAIFFVYPVTLFFGACLDACLAHAYFAPGWSGSSTLLLPASALSRLPTAVNSVRLPHDTGKQKATHQDRFVAICVCALGSLGHP